MFQRDERKAAENLAKHGIRFEDARAVFQDPFAIEWLLYVAYALRGDDIRLISARGAEPYERRRYHDENA
ncbi:BrnT family toxin [Nitrospirillum amazonense]|uniref:BrnT family toxin n=1 Tax=Nitrospirillum amazonense TaxID=28077 RepID=UPI0024123685|nr:BrnT family toxin [Nitrospirillum amazonense]MDG3442018.1 BrnT family toxin [Nitrospirillum amazonense]